MYETTTHVIAVRTPSYLTPGIDIHLYQKTNLDGVERVSIAEPITVKAVDTQMPVSTSPLLCLSLHEAQMLIDSLWDCGLRPSEGSGSAGAMAATERHLEDMRKLVFRNPEPDPYRPSGIIKDKKP